MLWFKVRVGEGKQAIVKEKATVNDAIEAGKFEINTKTYAKILNPQCSQGLHTMLHMHMYFRTAEVQYGHISNRQLFFAPGRL